MIKSIIRFFSGKRIKKNFKENIIYMYKDIVKLPFYECQTIEPYMTYDFYKRLRYYCGIDKVIIKD